MTKRQLIDRITTINVSAHPSFLASFGEDDLQAYLEHLRVLEQPRLPGDPVKYEKYFTPAPKPQFIYDAAHDNGEADASTGEVFLVPVSADEQTADADAYQAPQSDAHDSDDASSAERPLAPVMAGDGESDKSYVADDDSDSWLF